jgi:hypothetical protein
MAHLIPPFSLIAFVTRDTPMLGLLIWASAAIWYLLLLASTVFSARNQGLHDRAAGSLVCNLEHRVSSR